MKKASKEKFVLIQKVTGEVEKVELKKSKFCSNFSPIHVSDNMSGKMSGIPSISTLCLINPLCLARMKNGELICSKCFAAATASRYSGLYKALESNYHLLTESILPLELLPKFRNVSIVRIESFGDCANVIQAKNYLNIARANPEVTFAVWSKNMFLYAQAIAEEGKPANIVFIESSERLNVEKPFSFSFVDHVFTVFDKEHAKNVEINCGARDCASCRRCYKKDTEFSVFELLK